MNRRELFQGLGAIIAGIAIDKAIPFNRVWSFPKKIKVVNVRMIRGNFAELLRPGVHEIFTQYLIKPKVILIAPENQKLARWIIDGRTDNYVGAFKLSNV